MGKIIKMKPSLSMRSISDIKAMREACLGGPMSSSTNKALDQIKPYGLENDPLES